MRDIHTELDHCYPQSTDSVAKAREDTNRLCQLLQGLRPEFKMIRSQLYNREEEPTFDEAVTKLMQEENRLQAIKGVIEGNAYITKGQRNYGQPQGQYPRKNESEKLWCAIIAKKQGTPRTNVGSFMAYHRTWPRLTWHKIHNKRDQITLVQKEFPQLKIFNK